MYSIGFAVRPRPPKKNASATNQPSQASGARHNAHAAGLTIHVIGSRRLAFVFGATAQSTPASMVRVSFIYVGSEPLFHVHVFIQMRDLFFIAIEHQGFALEQFADPPFRRLRPARMADARIYVREEAVFTRRRVVPTGRRHGLLKLDFKRSI